MRKLCANFLCKTGELDLVMVDTDRTIVFIEVKTRADEDFVPAESAITAEKQARVYRAAKYFMAVNNIHNRPVRFDVVTVVGDGGRKKEIRHYPDAFRL